MVVCYVNSSAEVKAECDVCCTSSNSVKVVASIEEGRPILFAPDKYLGSFTASKTGKNLILWPGYCPTHMKISVDDIAARKAEHPEAEVLVHPECRSEVIALADQVLSTGGMMKRARESDSRAFVIGTEVGILHRLRKENPGKTFIPASRRAVCPNMKTITLEKVLWSLERMEFRVTVPADVRDKAFRSVDRMLSLV
jgi:quinolinate synthase